MRSPARFLAPLGLFAAVLLFAATAAANSESDYDGTCESDADCWPGEVCIHLPMSSDASWPWASEGFCEPYSDWDWGSDWSDDWSDWWTPCTTDADCAEGEYCFDFEGEGECIPDWIVECNTDADCGPGLRCLDADDFDNWSTDGWTDWPEPTQWTDDWMDTDSDFGTSSAMPKRSTSGSGLYFCLPEWLDQGECDTDADCQAGFECDFYEYCSCPGWSGPSWADGSGSDWEPSSTPAPEPFRFGSDDDGCECWASDTGWCELVEVECSTNADCPENWTCSEDYGGDGACGIDPDGNEWCDTIEPVFICLPPYYEDLMRGGGGGFGDGPTRPGAGDRDPEASGASDAPSAPGSTGEGALSEGDDSAAAPGTGGPGTDGPGTGGPGTDGPGAQDPGTDGPGAQDPGSEDPGSDAPGADDADAPGSSNRSSGCSAAPGAPGSLPAALGFLFLVGLVRRRHIVRG